MLKIISIAPESKRIRRVLISTPVFLLSFVGSVIFFAQSALAATINVPADFATIQAAVDAAAVSGDTITVDAGTYNVTQIFINGKSLTLTGAGAATTIIDGGQNALPSAGMIRVRNVTAGPVVIQGFTLQNAGLGSGDITAIAISHNNAASPITIQNNHIIGYNGGNAFDKGVWTYGGVSNGTSPITISNNEFEKMWQGVLLELPRGGATVENNNFHDLVASNDGVTLFEAEGIFAFTYDNGDPGNDDISSALALNTNSFASYSGEDIAVSGGYSGSGTRKFTNVTINNNTLNAIGSGLERRHVGIYLINTGLIPGDALLGGVDGATISGNTITTGGADSFGIHLAGPNNNATIQNNTISGLGKGIATDESAPGAGFSTGLLANFKNSFSGNTVAVSNGSAGVGDVIDATNNWWGAASGPTHASNPPGTGDVISDNVLFEPWYEDAGMTTLAKPVAILSGTPASPTNSQTADITVGGAGVVAYEYDLDAGGFGGETAVANHILLSALTEGSHTLSVNGKDSGDIWQVTPTIYSWTVDLTAPSTPTASSVAGTYTSTQSITLSSTDSTSIRFTTDSTDPTTCSSGTLYVGAISVSSTQTIEARGCDNAGNISALGTFTYTISAGGGGGGGGGSAAFGRPSCSGSACNGGVNNPPTTTDTTTTTTTNSGTTTTFGGTSFFTDTTGSLAQDYINQLYQFGVTGYIDANGNPLHLFMPENQITRAELIVLLMKVKYGTLPAVTVAPFKDVPADHWAAPYITKAKEMGIVSGYNGGNFRPNASASRGETLKMILLTWFTPDQIAAATVNTSCTDIVQTQWYAKYFNFALNKAIVSGLKDASGNPTGICGPASNVTRAESAKMTVMTYGLL